MKSKSRTILLLIITLLFLSNSLIPNINAASYVALGTMSDTDNFDIPERNLLTHSTGKAIISWIHANGKRVEVRIVSSTGVTQSNYYFNVMDEGITQQLLTLSIAEIDEDEVIILAVSTCTSSPEYTRAAVSRLNVNTYAHTEYTRNGIGAGYQIDVTGKGRLSNILEINNILYCLFIGMYGAHTFNTIITFNPSTNTLSSPYEANDILDITTVYIQNPTIIAVGTSGFICIIAETEQEYLKTYVYDITGITFTYLGISASNYKMNYNRYLDIVDYGIEDYEYGEDIHYYLYFVYSTSENLGYYTPAFQTYIFRQIFNNTFTSATLIGNSIYGVSISPYGSPIQSTNPWTVGINKQNSHTEYYIWYPYYSGYWDESYHWDKYKLVLELGNNTLSAFKDIDTTLSVESDTIDTLSSLEFYGSDDLLYKEPYSQYQLSLIYSDDTIILYYAVAGLIDYFTMTDSYTPVDIPLEMGEQYTFTYTFYNNYVLYSGGIVLIYIDDSLISSKITDTNGVVTLDVVFNSLGTHVIEIEFYKNTLQSTPNLEDESTYTVVYVEPPTEQQNISLFGATLINAVISILPVAAIIFLPAGYGAKSMGMVGFLAGLIVGVSIAVSSGFLPFYYVYLLGLVIIMGFVFIVRSGGGSMVAAS